MAVETRRLVIAGAGGLGREVLELVHAVNEVRAQWEPVGWLDDDPSLEGTRIRGLPVLGPVALARELDDAAVAVCMAAPLASRRTRSAVEELELGNDRKCTLVHPSASLPAETSVGPGSLIFHNVVLTAAAYLGSHVTLMPSVVLTHDDRLDDYVTVASGAKLGGRVHLRQGAYVGAGAVLRQDVTVGEWSVVGMAAAVTRDIPPKELWFGVPAKFARKVDQ